MAKRRVTITAAWIGGTCVIIAAIIGAVGHYLSVQPAAIEKPPRAVGDDSGQGATPYPSPQPPIVEKSPPLVSDDSGRDFNSPRVIDAEQSVASYGGSFDDYIARLAALKDRNFERQEFLDSMVGQHVVWRGSVYRVGGARTGDSIGVTITAPREGFGVPPFMSVWFPASAWRTKLYALRNGDQVEVGAIYREGGSHAEHPILDGLSISIVEPK